MFWTDQPGTAGWPGSGVCRQVTEGAPGRVTKWGGSAAVGIGGSQLDLKSILFRLGLFIYFHILGSG